MRKGSALLAVLACALLLPAAVSAQKLETGTWTGRVSPPNDEVQDVVMDVTVTGDSASAILRVPALADFPPMAVQGLKLTPEGKLTFAFQANRFVTCELARGTEGKYTGSCAAEGSNDVATIEMHPPKKPDGK